MLILLHTSKTMRKPLAGKRELTEPVLQKQAVKIVSYIRTLSVDDLARAMKITPKLAFQVQEQFANWGVNPAGRYAAVDAFLGDIYSGLQVQSWTNDDRAYAQDHLRILSGLYGILRHLDAVYPYRLEMGYRFKDSSLKNMYSHWADTIAQELPSDDLIIDLTAAEYSKVVLPYITGKTIVRPRFLTRSPKTGVPTFVVVHAKIARGAFAAWLIRSKITSMKEVSSFNNLGYHYDAASSTPTVPVFICDTFGGLGLSVRLS